MSRVAVVGAGALGLVAALRLSARGHDVTVFESGARVGGLALGFFPAADSDALECFYHHIFASDREIVALISELGLADRLTWKKPGTSLFYGGELERIDSAGALFKLRRLTFADRVRLAAALTILKLAPSVRFFENRLAIPWLREIAGTRAFDVVFAQIFESKFGVYAGDISLGWLWARIHDRTASLGYLVGGFDVFYQALVDRIRRHGGEVITEARVTAIQSCASGLSVKTRGSQSELFDRVLATIPLARLGRIVPEFPRAFIERYETRASLRARSLVLALDRRLTEYYWINVAEKNYPFLVVVEQTNFVDASHYAGAHLVYFGNYGCEFPRRSAEELLDEFVPYIRSINPAFERAWVRDAWVFEAPDAQPVVTPRYAAQISPHRTPVHGLYVANINHVYPHDRGQNYAVALGTKLASLIDASFRAR